MIKHRLIDLWKAAGGDGASSPAGPAASRTRAEFDQLLDAWTLERGRSIESELLLDRARAILARSLASDAISAAERRRIRALIRAIDRSVRRQDPP